MPRGKVVRGADGWLFLHRDTNRVMGQQSGEIRLDANQLTQWRVLLDTRHAWLERQVAAYVFLIAPNAASIYPEMLPDGFQSSAHRPVHQLLDHLSQHGSPARTIYPEAELLALKQEDAPYARNETHWTDPGAFRAYERLLDELAPGVDLRRLSRDDLDVARDTNHGDLGRQVEPPVEAEHVYTHVREPRARLVSDNRVRNTGRRVVYESDAADGAECLVYGDSFAMRVLQFLAESFRRLTFVHMANLDRELVQQLQPDVVVKIMNERFLIAVPVDDPAKTQAELEAERLAAGEVLPPQQQPPRPGRALSLSL